MRSVAKRVY